MHGLADHVLQRDAALREESDQSTIGGNGADDAQSNESLQHTRLVEWRSTRSRGHILQDVGVEVCLASGKELVFLKPNVRSQEHAEITKSIEVALTRGVEMGAQRCVIAPSALGEVHETRRRQCGKKHSLLDPEVRE